jgi:transposase
LEELFAKLPKLKTLYELRLRFQHIFDTAKNRKRANYELYGLRLDALEEEIDLEPFFTTYDNWEEEILHYFDARQTSAQVEGINNKARVITKRAYGLKSADSLWRRLMLDVNEAKNLIGRSIDSIRELVAHFRVVFRPLCT